MENNLNELKNEQEVYLNLYIDKFKNIVKENNSDILTSNVENIIENIYKCKTEAEIWEFEDNFKLILKELEHLTLIESDYDFLDVMSSICFHARKLTYINGIKNAINHKMQENDDGYKCGDILKDIWGYDQTNVDFYQVIHTSKKSIKVAQIQSKLVCDTLYEETIKPCKNCFVIHSVFTLRSKSPRINTLLRKINEDDCFKQSGLYNKH